MKKYAGIGIIVLVVLLIFAPPVAGWHAIVSKSGPGEEFTNCDSVPVPYTIDATSSIWDLSLLEITDTLPQHLVFGSITSSWPDYIVDTSQAGKVIITFFNVPKNTDIHISLVLNPDSSNPPVAGDTLVNTVSSRVKGCQDGFYITGQCVHPFSYWEGYRSPAINPEGSTVSVPITCMNSIPAPEFPTAALPAALIVGIIGAVLFINKTKEM